MTTVKPQKPDKARRSSARVARLRVIATILTAIVGMLVLLYPIVITQLTNMEQQRIARDYSSQVQHQAPSELASDIARAIDYNNTRSYGPILDPWLARISQDNQDYQDYLHQLARYETMGRIAIPRINVDLPIYHGTSEETLMKGVGHLYGSDLPVGGLGTHAVMTAHTGMTHATLFDNLKELSKGDPIYLDVAGQRMKYEVSDSRVVLPNETDSLRPEDGKDQITLITCTPYGINTHRLLVTAQRVPLEDGEADGAFAEGGMNWQWWMWVLIAIVIVAAVCLLCWIYRLRRARQRWV